LRLRCPNRTKCSENVPWSEVVCPGCGAATGFGARVKGFFSRLTRITCPACHKDVPWSEKSCPQCGQAMTMEALFRHGGFFGAERFRRIVNTTDDATRKRVQRWFLVVSALLCIGLNTLDTASKRADSHYVLLGVFLPILFLFAFTFTPYRLRMTLAYGTSGLFKLAVAVNVLNVVVALKLLIGTFEDRAEALALCVGVMVVSLTLLKIFVVPLWFYLVWLFHYPGFSQTHGPQDEQGHNVKVDHG
jgi:hypothetical protein